MSNSTPELYGTMKDQFKGLIDGIDNFVTNASGLAALIFNSLEDINWAGFYFIDRGKLLVGPYQGKVACVEIDLGKGVCGYAAVEKGTVIVDDVHLFEGHIACDPASQSEIVVPIIVNDKVLGVLDIDAPVKARFTETDAKGLNELINMLVQGSYTEKMFNYLSG